MGDLVRDAPLGQLVRLFTNKVLLHQEERPGWQCPEHFKTGALEPHTSTDVTRQSSSSATAADTPPVDDAAKGLENKAIHDAEKGAVGSSVARRPTITDPVTGKEYILVTWYGPDDPDNPQRWSLRKKVVVLGVLCWLTIVVYMAAAIISPGIASLIAEYGISELVSTFAISLYVLGYGLGPAVFSPLSEVPKLGRSIFYIVPLGVYFALSFAVAWTPTFAGFLILRFLTGFVASPALATGAATVIDILGQFEVSYGLSIWVLAAYGGPGLGPVIAAWQTVGDTSYGPAGNWRWAMWTQLIFVFSALVLTFIALPETSADKILYERARRLRKITGNKALRSQSEINQAHLSRKAIVSDALLRPLQITIKDPSVAYVNIYISLFYGLYYLFFAAFPIVFFEEYGMSLTIGNLPYLSIAIGGTIFAFLYIALLKFAVEPKVKAGQVGEPEDVLIPGLMASIIAVVGLWLFAWTAGRVHWIAPCIGVALFAGGAFVTLQCIFAYLAMAYPKYSASLFAANDTMRSTMAFALLIAGTPLFRNLGIAPGCSLTAGLLTALTPGYFVLFVFGKKLRARSRFTVHADVGSESPEKSV